MAIIDKQVPAGNCDAHEPNDGHLPVAYGDIINNIITSLALANRYSSGWVFTSVNIPQGAPITAAHVSIYTTSGILNNDIYAKVYGNYVDNANNFQDEAVLFNRTRTTAVVTWGPADDLPVGWADSPDIASIIQEIVNRPGWAANNDMCILGIGHFYGLTDRQITFRTYENDPTLAPKLHIEYEAVAEGLGAFYQQLNPLGINMYRAGRSR